MKKQYLALLGCFLLAVLVFMSSILLPKPVQAVFSTDIQFNAKSAVVIDADSGRVLAEKNKDMQLAMASTTKIMTALVALENTDDLDEIFATYEVDTIVIGMPLNLKGEKTVRVVLPWSVRCYFKEITLNGATYVTLVKKEKTML